MIVWPTPCAATGAASRTAASTDSTRPPCVSGSTCSGCDRVDRPVDALLADRPRGTELLGPQADAQLLDHPRNVADIVGGRACLRKSLPQFVVCGLHGMHGG